MNAAERLWRGLAARDWNSVRAQMHEHATIAWPHSGQRLTVDEYIAAQAARTADRDAEVHRVACDGEIVAVEASVGDERCAGFYDLHGGRVDSATEYWIRPGG